MKCKIHKVVNILTAVFWDAMPHTLITVTNSHMKMEDIVCQNFTLIETG